MNAAEGPLEGTAVEPASSRSATGTGAYDVRDEGDFHPIDGSDDHNGDLCDCLTPEVHKGAYPTTDWCLTCQEAVEWQHRAVHGVTHQTVCKPVAGWGTCPCFACGKAEAQMLGKTDSVTDGDRRG